MAGRGKGARRPHGQLTRAAAEGRTDGKERFHGCGDEPRDCMGPVRVGAAVGSGVLSVAKEAANWRETLGADTWGRKALESL